MMALDSDLSPLPCSVTSFSGPMVGMAIQNSICSPDFSGGVNMVSCLQVSSFPHILLQCLGPLFTEHSLQTCPVSELWGKKAEGHKVAFTCHRTCVWPVDCRIQSCHL